MQPTEHKQPAEEELIAHIRKSLMAHEESYEVGAWEKFNGKQPVKKQAVLWIRSLGAVAAVLAICFAFFVFTNKKNNKTNIEVTKIKPVEKIEQPLEAITEQTIEPITNVIEHTQKRTDAVMDEPALIAEAVPQQVVDHQTNSLPVVSSAQERVALNVDKTNPTAINGAVEQVENKIKTKVPLEVSKPNILEFLANETRKNETEQTKEVQPNRPSKWEMGLMVSPSFGGTNKLNMGYGVSMDYQLSDRISISSGLAYNEMSASKNLPNAGTSATILVGDNRNLESVNERVVGLDIPLEIKYHLNKNIYANIGISAFAVLDQKRNNVFVEETVVRKSSNNGSSTPNYPSPGNGGGVVADFINSYALSQRSNEEAPTTGSNAIDYIGFYNFSFGYKKKISKKNSISIEPFIKLPIKEVTQDNLKLIGSGMRLRFDF